MLPIALAVPALIKNAKLIGVGLVFAAVFGIIFLGYKHYTGVIADNAALHANVASLTAAVEQQRATNKAALDALKRWKEAEKLASRAKKKAEAVGESARREGKRLDEALKKDLTAEQLAARNDINRLLRMLERETSHRRARGG